MEQTHERNIRRAHPVCHPHSPPGNDPAIHWGMVALARETKQPKESRVKNMPIRKRHYIALALTALLTCLTWLNVRAQEGAPPQQTGTSSECASCHPDVYEAWHLGRHSEVQTGHVLGESTNCMACHKEIPLPTDISMPTSDYPAMQGQPSTCMTCHTTGYDPETGKWKADGITCEACHSPMPADHPAKMAPIHDETGMCRNCHTGDRFGWESWQTSAHYQNDMVCSTCHNPHTTSLKLMSGEKDASSLCQNCHRAQSQNAQHSAHAKTGITCVGCHLGEPIGPDDFHKIPDHDFRPSLDLCMECHSAEMHAGQVIVATDTPTLQPSIIERTVIATLSPGVPQLSLTPNPFQVVGMTALAGLVGGIVLNAIRKRL
jgi:predicted CXXCH cytochrome family protein